METIITLGINGREYAAIRTTEDKRKSINGLFSAALDTVRTLNTLIC